MKRYAPLLVIVILGQTACSHTEMKRAAYQALRVEDCKLNNLEDFCLRTYAHEYHEYERQRQEFLRSQQQDVWRAVPVELIAVPVEQSQG